MFAAGMAAGDVVQAVQVAEHGLSAMDHAGAREVAVEMLATFKQGPNGSSARVKAEQVDQWREGAAAGLSALLAWLSQP